LRHKINPTRRRVLTGAGAVLAAPLVGRAARAADAWPSHPVRVIIPYPPGGGADTVGRIFFAKLSEALGQTFVIDNRGGAGGTIAEAVVAKAEPDGYTILYDATAFSANPFLYPKLSFDYGKDFQPVFLASRVANLLIVHPSVEAKTVADVIALGKAAPQGLDFASSGNGTVQHLSLEMFRHMTGIKINHIPYRGGGPALGDVVAGHVPIMFGDVGPVTGLVREGRVRGLGVTVGKRVETIPEVPTMVEAGLAGYEANSWQSLVAPANLPPSIAAALNAALTGVLAEPATREHFLKLGMQPLSSTPEELAMYLRAEIQKWAPVIKAAGATEE